MSIGSTIKKLRRERDMTQEQLAEYLGITANAVSQWECDRTMPDISQLPILANIFDITTDYLLGVDISQKNKYIEKTRNEAWELCNAGNKEGAADIIRCALVNYPNSFIMMSDIVLFLYQRAFHQNCTPEERHSFCTEAAGYIDTIIRECNDIKIRNQVLELACGIFPVIGRKEDAVTLISDVPDISKDEILSMLYNGEKLIEHISNIICKSVSTAADQTVWLASQNRCDGSPLFDDDIRILLYGKAISFYKTLYEEGDFFFDSECLSNAQKHIADIFASRSDTDNTLYHLGECVKYTLMFDTYDETVDTYSSIIRFGRSPVGINQNNAWNKSHEVLLDLTNDRNYDFIRLNPDFQNLIEQLKETDNMK